MIYADMFIYFDFLLDVLENLAPSVAGCCSFLICFVSLMMPDLNLNSQMNCGKFSFVWIGLKPIDIHFYAIRTLFLTFAELFGKLSLYVRFLSAKFDAI